MARQFSWLAGWLALLVFFFPRKLRVMWRHQHHTLLLAFANGASVAVYRVCMSRCGEYIFQHRPLFTKCNNPMFYIASHCLSMVGYMVWYLYIVHWWRDVRQQNIVIYACFRFKRIRRLLHPYFSNFHTVCVSMSKANVVAVGCGCVTSDSSAHGVAMALALAMLVCTIWISASVKNEWHTTEWSCRFGKPWIY